MSIRVLFNVFLVRFGIRHILPSDYINGISVTENNDPMVQLLADESLVNTDGNAYFGRKGMIERLLKVAKKVSEKGLRLYIYQIYRSPGTQTNGRNELYEQLKQKYPDWSQNLGVVVFGQNADRYASLFPFPCYAMNYVSSEQELVQIYNSVDLYVTSSLMENLPNTIMEAMASGIPCVGFNIGGIPEMIDHQQNGYVAEYQSANDLADGIKWSLQEEEYPKLRISSRKKVLRSYSEEIVAKQYISLYHQLLNSHA